MAVCGKCPEESSLEIYRQRMLVRGPEPNLEMFVGPSWQITSLNSGKYLTMVVLHFSHLARTLVLKTAISSKS